MKDFKHFKESMSDEVINQILESRIERMSETSKTIEFEDSIEEFVWQQRTQTIGLIFDFLEEYHKWLNS